MYYVTDAHPTIIERTLYNRVLEEMAQRSGKQVKIEKLNTTGKTEYSWNVLNEKRIMFCKL